MTPFARLPLVLTLAAATATPALAQDEPLLRNINVSGLIDAFMALRRVVIENRTTINGNIYAGVITTTVDDRDGNANNFADRDVAAVSLTARRGASPLTVNCPRGDRAAIEACLRSNFTDVVNILFPTGLAESVSGRDPAVAGAQESLAISALANATVSE